MTGMGKFTLAMRVRMAIIANLHLHMAWAACMPSTLAAFRSVLSSSLLKKKLKLNFSLTLV